MKDEKTTPVYGFKPELDEVLETDYIFGAAGGITDDFTLPENENWFDYYSKGEYQFSNRFDSFGCVTYSALESIEAILNAKKRMGLLSKAFVSWCLSKGYFNADGDFDFMEQYIAKLSRTDEYGGNSGSNVGEAIRKFGLIPQSLRPFDKDTTKAEYYQDISEEELRLGSEWNAWMEFKYERVRTSKADMEKALKHSPLQVYVYAWKNPVGGVYQRTGQTSNHAVSEGQPEWFIRDSYTEDARYGEDFKKQLAYNFDFYTWGYKYQLLETKKKDMPETNDLVKRVKRNGSQGRGYYIEALSSDVYIQLSKMFGLEPMIKGMDWENEPIEGEVTIYDQPVEIKGGNWITDLLSRIFKS